MKKEAGGGYPQAYLKNSMIMMEKLLFGPGVKKKKLMMCVATSRLSTFHRTPKNVLAGEKALSMRYFYEKSYGNRFIIAGLTCITTVATLAAVHSYNESKDEPQTPSSPASWLNSMIARCSPNNKEFLTLAQLSKYIQEKLEQPRYSIRKSGLQPPSIKAQELFMQKGDATHLLSIKLDPKNSHITSLASEWFKVFQDSPGLYNSKVKQFIEYLRDKDEVLYKVVSNDRQCSMTIVKQKDIDQGLVVYVMIFKDKGFTRDDADFILKGYKDAFELKQIIAKNEWADEVVELDLSKGSSPFLGGNIIMESVEGDQARPLYGFTTPQARDRNTAQDPISTLLSLGAEVFDRSSNQELDWSYLAGYDHVKKQIEDTVVNALQYPEVYDRIARNTRVSFEHNRPKAILLEGPPGTGKTLAARILANQCNQPLIILKLESIVSKWYGESEKTLSKASFELYIYITVYLDLIFNRD